MPGLGRFPEGGDGNPLPVLLPEESHGQRSLAYQGDSYNSPVPPKHAGKKQPHGGQQKPSYGSGYQPHQGQQQSYSQSQYGNYGPPQGKQKGYSHGQGNYSSYSNSYGSPGGGGGSDYSYESKFSELAGRAPPQAWWRA